MENNEGDIGGNSGGSGSLQSVDSHNNAPFTNGEYMNSTGVGASAMTNNTTTSQDMSGVENFAVATSMPKNMDNYRRGGGNDINISDGHAAMGVIEVSGHGNVNHNTASAEDLVSGISGSGSGGSFFNRGHGSYEQLE